MIELNSSSKLHAIFFASLMIMWLFAGAVALTDGVAAQADGSVEVEIAVDVSDLPGDGTDTNPYKISNISELQAMEEDPNANYELVSDIDASNTVQFNNRRGFDPVGNFSDEFTGSFDGDGHVITGLAINRPNESEVGLFGRNSGTVRNVALTEVTVTGNSDVGGLIGGNSDFGTVRNTTVSGSVTGDSNVGGLVGENEGGEILNSSAEADITGNSLTGGLVGFNVDDASIISSFATGSVDGTTFIGGLAGVNFQDSLVLNSHATGDVSGESNTGGLIGDNNAAVVNQSYATGTVSGSEETGGLVGDNFNGALISSSYATGAVSGINDVGGLVGNNGNNQDDTVGENQSDGTIVNSFATGTTSGESDVGGLVGENLDGAVEDSYWDEQSTGQATSAGSAIGLTTAQMQGQAAASNMSGFEFGTIWQTQANTNDYPALIALQDTDQPQLTPTTTVQFNDQTVQDGSASVDIRSTTFETDEAFNIVVHQAFDENADGTIQPSEIGTKIGESTKLDSGTRTNIRIDINKQVADDDNIAQLTETQTLVAMLHTVNTSDADNVVHTAPIVQDGTPVFDDAIVTVSPSTLNSSVNLNSSNPEPGSAITVTATATPENSTAGFSFAQSFNQSVADASDLTTQIAGSSVNPLIEEINENGTVVVVVEDDVTAGEQITIEYTITTAETDGKSVTLSGSVTNGQTTELPEKSYTITDAPIGIKNNVTLSDSDPTPSSSVTVTVTATPENSTAGFSFAQSFNQSVATVSDLTTQVAGSSVDPVIEAINENGTVVVVVENDVTTGEQITIEYTITTAETDGKSVSLSGSVTNGPNSNTELPEKSYTISALDGDRELVIQPPSQIDRGEPFVVEVLNTSEVTVADVPVTLNLGPATANQTTTTNTSGIAIFEMPTAETTTTEVITLTASPDGLPAYATGDQITVTGIRDSGDIQLQNLSVTPTELPRNNSITVTAEIANTNETSLNQTLTLRSNKTQSSTATNTLDTTTATIPGDTTRAITLTGRLLTLGAKNITVNGQSAGTVTITEITSPTPDIETPQLNETPLPAEVNATTDVNVTVPVTNTGDEPGQFTLNLTVADEDALRTRTRTIELNATETRPVAFETLAGDLSAQPTPFTVTVTATTTTNASRNTSLTTNLSIAPPDDASLQITKTRTPSRVSDQDRFTVSARVGNFGANVTTDELTFAVDTDRDGSFNDETTQTRTRTLPANETARVAFRTTAIATTDQLPLPFRLRTDSDTATGNLSVVSTGFTTAISTGDPHIVSFDGVAYDFQAAGEFILAREPTQNGSLVVQARQEPLAGSESITRNTAVATVLDNNTVIIDATDSIPLQINGSEIALNRSETITVGNGTITRTQDGNTLTVTYPGANNEIDIDDERLTADLYDDRVDIELSLDPGRDRPVEGVFGPADGNVTNDIGLPNGTVLAQPPQAEQLYGVFRQSWRVNDSTTLFAYENDNGPETYYDPTIPAEAVSLADLDQTDRQEAEQRAIDAGLQPGTVAFRNAVLDFALTGDGSYLTSAQQQSTSAETTTVVGAPTESIVRVESASLGPGGTADVNLTLERAPEGLAGYNLTTSVSVAETSGVRVTDATAPDIFNNSVTETTVGQANQTAEIRATDIKTVVESNATDISLGEITVTANETADVSEIPITLSVSRIDDDSGSPIDIEIQNGTVSVTEQPPLAEGLNPPTDPDNDGVLEDVNGNGRLDFNDVVILFENLPDAETPLQDINNNGRIDFDDIVELFKEI